LTLSPPREISRTAVNQLALPYCLPKLSGWGPKLVGIRDTQEDQVVTNAVTFSFQRQRLQHSVVYKGAVRQPAQVQDQVVHALLQGGPSKRILEQLVERQGLEVR
jgi:hypothetical protein